MLKKAGHANFYFAPDDGEGGEPKPKDPPVETPPPAAATEPEPTPTEPTPTDPPGDDGVGDVQMTTEQLAQRLDRAKSTEKTALLKALGMGSIKDLKTVLKQGQAALESQMSDAEKQVKALDDAQKALEASNNNLEVEKKKADALRLQMAATSLMASGEFKFANPATAFKLLDLTEVQQDETTGNFIGLELAIQSLAEKEPWTLQTSAAGGTAPQIGPTNPDQKKISVTDDDRRQRYFGGGSKVEFFEGGGVKTKD
jgi:hypothetical protein